MSHDLRELLEQTARGPCDDGFDPAGVAARARRQVRSRATAVAVSVLVAVVGGAVWVGSLGATPPAPYVDTAPPPRPSATSTTSAADPSPTPPSVTPQASATQRPTDLDVGPVLDPHALPAMSSHGVAVQVSAGVVFVGLDGTVHGHLPGAELDTGGPATSVPGPVPVRLPRAAGEELATRWIHPPSGSTAPVAPTTPLWGAHEVVHLETGSDPSPAVLLRWDDGGNGEELARFSPNLQWHVSSDHRVATWHDCPDGAEDLSTCTARAYDTDMGAQMDLQPGCWVSDSFADLNHAVVCWQSWGAGGSSWIERHGPPPEGRRIDLPRYDGQPADTPDIGHYVNAFLAGEHVVATWSAECEVRHPVVIRPDGVPRPLVGDDFTTAPTGAVLGVSRDGDAVVHVPADPACGQAGQPGLHLVDPGTGRTTPVILTDGLAGAEMWSPQPELDGAG